MAVSLLQMFIDWKHFSPFSYKIKKQFCIFKIDFVGCRSDSVRFYRLYLHLSYYVIGQKTKVEPTVDNQEESSEGNTTETEQDQHQSENSADGLVWFFAGSIGVIAILGIVGVGKRNKKTSK